MTTLEMTTLVKKKNTYQITEHGNLRLNQRFGHLKTENQIMDAFRRSVGVTKENVHRDHGHYVKKFYRMMTEHPTAKMLVNTYHDMVFIVDGATIITVYYYDNSQYYTTGRTIKYARDYK